MEKLDHAAHDDLTDILGIQTHRSRNTEEALPAGPSEQRAALIAEFPKPFGPVFQMTEAQMMKYFAKVLRHVFKIEGILTRDLSFNIYATKKVNANGTTTFVPPKVVCPNWIT